MRKYDNNHFSLSIIIPVYRSEKILDKLVGEIEQVCLDIDELKDFEMILVCDSSPDNSWNIIQTLAESKKFILGICLRRNFGQHNAIMAGLSYAEGKYQIIMDDDLQHSPLFIPKLIDALRDGADVCYTRYINRKHPLWKKLGSRFNNLIATFLLSKPQELYLSSFKAIRREISKEVTKYSGPYAYLDGLILDVTSNITSIDIEHMGRYSGDGGYNLSRSISLWLKMATGFSIVPLRFASLIGLFITTIAFLAISYIVIASLISPAKLAGWPSVMTAILFLGGVQLACIGIIGEYVGRSYLLINKKPQFVIKEFTGTAESLLINDNKE